MHVLFACDCTARKRTPANAERSLHSRRRAWGFASHDRVEDHRRDVIDQPIANDLDVSGWELRKVLRLLRKSNPPPFDKLRALALWK